MNFEIKKYVEIERNSLPEKFKIKLKLGRYYSRLFPYGSHEDWSTVLNIKEIEKWYFIQVENNLYKGKLEQFIIDYGLEFDKYLIDEHMYLHLSGVKEIILK